MKSLLTLHLKSIIALAVSYFMGAYFAVAIGAPEFLQMAGVIAAILALVPKGINLKGSLAESAITITDIIAEYGNYYKKGSQAVKDIRVKLMQPSVTEDFFGTRTTTDTRIQLANASITRVLQAYQSAFTPISTTKFTPQIINLDHFKIDAKILPHDLMESWLGFLADNAQTPKDTPLVKYWLENLVIPQSKEDLEQLEIFWGVKAAPVPNTPAAPGTSMNGIKEKLKQAGVNVVTMGTVPTDAVEFVSYVEDFFANIPELGRKFMKKIAMNTNLELRFKQGMRLKYNMHYAQATDTATLIDFPVKVVGLPSHDGHNVIWTTPEDNKIVGNKNPGNQTTFDIQPADREVKVLTDFHKGVGFWTPNLVFRSDISLTNV
jgi:hypothetical protein